MNARDSQLLIDALAFAALKHRDQRRKDPEASPYINHPKAVIDRIRGTNKTLEKLFDEAYHGRP